MQSTLKRKIHFSSAHALRQYDGLCGSIHGHNYDLELSVTLEYDINVVQIPLDLTVLAGIMKDNVHSSWDHMLILGNTLNQKGELEELLTNPATQVATLRVMHLLNVRPEQIAWLDGMEPSTENMVFLVARVLFHEISNYLAEQNQGAKLLSLTADLRETDNNAAQISVIGQATVGA